MQPLVTIVTPSFNSAKTIEATILSVLQQTYKPIEYIVMDGGSKDGTVEIARRYEPQLKVVSEPDKGQSDAINKGWRMAKGDILAWLNADDQYLPDTVQIAADYFQSHPEAKWVYGVLQSINPQGQPFPYRNFEITWNYDTLLRVGCYVTQPTVFLRRSVIDQFGLLHEQLHYAMDYEYWLRIGRVYPGHLITDLHARMIRSSETKTESGGVKRIKEIEAMVRQYGADDLPYGIHHEWTIAFMDGFLKDLRSGHWRDAARDFAAIWRYPRVVPRAAVKTFIRYIPLAWETKLRQWFVRREPNTQ